MIIWVKGVEDQNVRAKVLGSLGAGVRVQLLDDGRKFIVKLSDIIAIEFSGKLIAKFKFNGCFPPREF